MALLTSSGGLARVMGPLVFTDVYQHKGLYVVFGILLSVLGFAFTINVITYRRFGYATRYTNPTNIASVNLVMGCSKDFFSLF